MGLAPGPRFKSILAAGFEAQLEGAFTDETGGRKWLREYLQEHLPALAGRVGGVL